MQLHELFSAEPSAPTPTKAVKFRAMAPARDSKALPPKPREVAAVLAIVDEPETSASIRDAEVAIVEAYRDKSGDPIPIPHKARSNEEVYHFLFRALRDGQDPSKSLARTVLELRRAIDTTTARRLMTAYNEWIDAEFPDTVTADALKKLEGDAEGK